MCDAKVTLAKLLLVDIVVEGNCKACCTNEMEEPNEICARRNIYRSAINKAPISCIVPRVHNICIEKESVCP